MMSRRDELIYFERIWHEKHKGFFNDRDPEQRLRDINYTDFFEEPDDKFFLYVDAHQLLRGSCHLFALSLSKILGYSPYLIEDKNGGFHAFCQVHKNNQHYYIDARGVTTSFDEFMDVAREFVVGEFCIRRISTQEIKEWESNEDCYEEALAFAEAVIKAYEGCYRV